MLLCINDTCRLPTLFSLFFLHFPLDGFFIYFLVLLMLLLFVLYYLVLCATYTIRNSTLIFYKLVYYNRMHKVRWVEIMCTNYTLLYWKRYLCSIINVSVHRIFSLYVCGVVSLLIYETRDLSFVFLFQCYFIL